MSGFPILDLVVGMIFIFFLLSIICSSAVELWFSMLSTRAKLLGQWLVQIFNEAALDANGNPKLDAYGKPVTVGQEIMDHGMVAVLSKPGKATSYIDAKNFVSALLDNITRKPAVAGNNNTPVPPATLADYITAIQNSTLISGELKRTILIYANEAAQAATAIKSIPVGANITNNISAGIKSEMEHFRDRLENWYDSNADRLTGTLKRKKVMPATFIMATIITLSLNTDGIEISKYLYNNKDISNQLATTAMNSFQNYKDRVDTLTTIKDSAVKQSDIEQLNKKTDQLKTDIANLEAVNLPLGWSGTSVTNFNSFWNYFLQWKHIVGWLATILAICMGAPFWFDILNKIANLRGTGPKPASGNSADGKNS